MKRTNEERIFLSDSFYTAGMARFKILHLLPMDWHTLSGKENDSILLKPKQPPAFHGILHLHRHHGFPARFSGFDHS